MSSLVYRVLIFAVALALPAICSANQTGIVGVSGKQIVFCTSCHFGGDRPTVALELVEPAQIAPGALATFRFKVTSADPPEQKAGGLNIAVSGGLLGVIAGQGTQLKQNPVSQDQELTHISPKPNTNGEASWTFTWQAPTTPGTYSIFAAGNSVNLNEEQDGDLAEKTKLDVMVIAATPTEVPPSPTASATSVPPSSTPTLEPTAEPTSTATIELATPTATATGGPACTGDCDGQSDVTVDEIITGVNIALGNLAIGECLAFDRNNDEAVTVDEIVDAIQRALNGCG